MSKHVAKNINKIKNNFNLTNKFKSPWNPGSRIVPAKVKDHEYELRIDAGELVDGRYRILKLQINSQATSTALKAYHRKHGTHADLAVGRYDTEAEDADAETDRVVDEMTDEAINKI